MPQNFPQQLMDILEPVLLEHTKRITDLENKVAKDSRFESLEERVEESEGKI